MSKCPVCEQPYDCENAERIAELEAKLERQEAYYMGEREQLKALRDMLKRYRKETPLGHQPHMITEEVDKLLEGKADE